MSLGVHGSLAGLRYLFVLGDDVGEQVRIDLSVVAALLERDAVYLAGLNVGGLVCGVDLDYHKTSRQQGNGLLELTISPRPEARSICHPSFWRGHRGPPESSQGQLCRQRLLAR